MHAQTSTTPRFLANSVDYFMFALTNVASWLSFFLSCFVISVLWWEPFAFEHPVNCRKVFTAKASFLFSLIMIPTLAIPEMMQDNTEHAWEIEGSHKCRWLPFDHPYLSKALIQEWDNVSQYAGAFVSYQSRPRLQDIAAARPITKFQHTSWTITITFKFFVEFIWIHTTTLRDLDDPQLITSNN